jgi:hypothetical protein
MGLLAAAGAWLAANAGAVSAGAAAAGAGAGIYAASKSQKPPPPPQTPNPNNALNAAQEQSDALRQRRGLLANIYAGGQNQQPVSGATQLGRSG